MRIPNWFLVVLAICLAVTTGAFAIRLLRPEHDWIHDSDGRGAFDKKTAPWCFYNDGTGRYYCTDLSAGRPFVMRQN